MELFCRNRGSCQWNYFLKTLLMTVKTSEPWRTLTPSWQVLSEMYQVHAQTVMEESVVHDMCSPRTSDIAWLCFWIQQTSSQKSEAKVIAAAVGETVTFIIPVTGNIITFTWYRGRTVTTNQAIITYWPGMKQVTGPQYTAREMGLPDGSLQIKDVLKNYTGNYTRDLLVEIKSPVILTMQLRVYVRVSIPNVYVVTENLTENGSLVLFCNASGTDISYQWFLNKDLVVAGGRIFLSRNTLTLSPCIRSDTGTIFTCKAYNAVSNATSSPFTVSVSYVTPEKDKLPVWAIPLIGIGALVSLSVLIGLLWYFCCKRPASGAQKEEQTDRKVISPRSSHYSQSSEDINAFGENQKQRRKK